MQHCPSEPRSHKDHVTSKTTPENGNGIRQGMRKLCIANVADAVRHTLQMSNIVFPCLSGLTNLHMASDTEVHRVTS